MFGTYGYAIMDIMEYKPYVFLKKFFPNFLFLVVATTVGLQFPNYSWTRVPKLWVPNFLFLVVVTTVGLAQTHCRLAPTHLMDSACDSAYLCKLFEGICVPVVKFT